MRPRGLATDHADFLDPHRRGGVEWNATHRSIPDTIVPLDRRLRRVAGNSTGAAVLCLSDTMNHRNLERRLRLSQFWVDTACEGAFWFSTEGRITQVSA